MLDATGEFLYFFTKLSGLGHRRDGRKFEFTRGLCWLERGHNRRFVRYRPALAHSFELFDKTNLGATEFTEHINYRRALEGELERSIISLAEVEQARVHLTFSKDSVFLESQQPAKASVMVKVRPRARLAQQNVLAINHQMLALARSRGMATIPQQDWSVRRVVIGAASRDPGWPTAHDGTRVLVEGVGVRWPPNAAAESAGLEVRACSGPSARRRCPALEGRACPLVAGADVVVVSQPPDDPDWDRLREAHPVLHHAVPVCVELPHGEHPRTGEEALPEIPAADLVALVTDRARKPSPAGP